MNILGSEGRHHGTVNGEAGGPHPGHAGAAVHVSTCWRTIRDAQAEVDPFGRSFDALGEARASLEALAYHCTGQAGTLVLIDHGGSAGGRGGAPS